MQAEWIIIGQGLAGSCLARHMERANMDFLIVDQHLHRASSLVAAGLYNPIVFRKFNLSFQAPILIPYLRKFFAAFEAEFKQQVHFDHHILKVFTSHEESNNWSARCTDPGYDEFMDRSILSPQFNDLVNAPFGAGRVKQAGHVNLPQFLRTLAEHWTQQERLVDGKVSQLETGEQGVRLTLENGSTLEASKVIFCDGHLNKDFPYFNYLPLGATKGDVLTLRIPELKINSVLNRGFFILPLGDDLYRVGATYEWGNTDYEISEKGKEELIEKFESLIQAPYECIDQQSGLRPTVGDRRPLIGQHPSKKRLYLFNGMGSKGVMLAPYYADQFLGYLQQESTLDPEVDIERYRKRFS